MYQCSPVYAPHFRRVLIELVLLYANLRHHCMCVHAGVPGTHYTVWSVGKVQTTLPREVWVLAHGTGNQCALWTL